MSVNMFLFCKLIHLYQFSDSTCKQYDMVSYHLSFSFWLTSLKRQSLGLSILLQMALYHSFYSWVMLLFSHSVGSDSFWPHGLQHNRLPCPSPSPRACSKSCSLSQWCHPTISSSVIPFSCLQSSPASGSFPMSQALRIRWPKYWSFSFSISPSSEYSGLISFRTDCCDLLSI